MIQSYRSDNTEYNKNGDFILMPTSCKLSAELNGVWQLELTHPLDSLGKWKGLEENGVVAAPTFQGKKQLFRIDRINKKDSGITAIAYPIFFDSADDCFLLDARPTMKNGQEALNIMMAGSKYSGESNIKTVSTAYFVRRNLMSAINGDEDPSFVNRWGGEILYDNYKVIINEHVGGDYGTEVRYGKNMESINYEVDMSDVVTRIIPVAYNGYTLDGSAPWVDSPNIGKYAKVYTKEVKFDDVKLLEDASGDEGAFATLGELRAELARRCREMYANGADLPRVKIEVNMVGLERCVEYAGYEELEKVRLGDTVHCYNSRLDITTEARVIGVEWDCIKDTPGKITLGEFGYDYFSELSTALTAVKQIMGPHNTVVAERVQGVLNAINTQLRYQKNIAQRQDVRAILFEDVDDASPTYGAMSIGTQGFQIADKKTADGRDWDWTTAFTAKGGYADVFIAGIISDKTGKSFWNLDTGEMQLAGIFRQFATNGYKSVDIMNNMINFYSWNDNGNYVGSIGSVSQNENQERTYGLGLWCDEGDHLALGCRYIENGKDRVRAIIRIDGSKLDEPPYIRNTFTGYQNVIGAMGMSGGKVSWIDWVKIKVKCGLITGFETTHQSYT